MGWKPIETAPTEKSILVAYDDGSIHLVKAGDNDFEWRPYQKHSFAHSPTHWMPLPAVPAQDPA